MTLLHRYNHATASLTVCRLPTNTLKYFQPATTRNSLRVGPIIRH